MIWACTSFVRDAFALRQERRGGEGQDAFQTGMSTCKCQTHPEADC